VLFLVAKVIPLNLSFFRDLHWYIAILLAVIYWVGYGLLIEPLSFSNVIMEPKLFLFSILLYPIVEELVFRGLVQEFFLGYVFLQKQVLGLSQANIITSILFAIFHLLNHEWFWALLIFFPSLVFGYFKDRHQSVLPCILLHSIYNLGFLTFLS